MKSKSILVSALAAATLLPAAANAATFEFDGTVGGSPIDAPLGNVVQNCGTVGSDLCTADFSAGFDYSKAGIAFNATAYSGGVGLGTPGYDRGAADLLIQDIIGPNQGLGVISEAEYVNGSPADVSGDQINFDLGESILFTFDNVVTISEIALNSGLSKDCPDLGGGEGPCGDVGIIVDGVFNSFTDFVAGGILAAGGIAVQLTGTTFEFIGLTSNAGYSIERFTVNEVPIPGAIPLLISGLAGLGFASRRKKKA